MPGFLKTATVSTAVHKNHNKFDKSSNTITTQNFFSLKPVFYTRMIANDSINIDASMFCRLMPQVKPIMGSGRIVNRAFFVPWRCVFDGFDDFISQTPYHSADGTVKMLKSVPFFTMWEVQQLFLGNNYSSFVENVSDLSELSQAYDFVDFDLTLGSYNSYLFTDFGRYAYDIFISLGYKIAFRSEYESEAYWKGLKLSALNLLAYGKIWVDWYKNAAYDGSDVILSLFKKDPVVTGYEYSKEELNDLFYYTRHVMYDSDYFTAQWDNPDGPNNIRWNPGFEIKDIAVHQNVYNGSSSNRYGQSIVVGDTQSGSPIVNALSGSAPVSLSSKSASPVSLSQYIIDALKRATDFVHRRQMVGNRLIDNFLALFGVENSFEKIDRTIVVGHWDVPIRFGEVMATTDNQSVGQPLGDYAGKAVGFMEKPQHMSFENHDKHGIFMILSYIEPKIGYVDGIDRNNLDLAPLDFYQGDFDHLGVQATFQSELFFDGTHYTGWQETSDYDTIFGYMPRYAHMKVGHDILSGDFYRPLYKDSMKVWHMYRMFDKFVEQGEVPIHDYNFTVGDREQFNRIFAIQDAGEVADNFVSVFHFDVSQYSTMSKLWDNYEFENEEQHRQVVQRINGSSISD